MYMNNAYRFTTSTLLLFLIGVSLTAAQEKTLADLLPLWRISFNGNSDLPTTLYHGDRVVYYFENDVMKVIDVATGELMWQVDYSLITIRDYTILPATG
jgi:hypothetical protein